MRRIAVLLALTLVAAMAVAAIESPVVNAASKTRGGNAQALRETDVAWSKIGAAKDLDRMMSFFTDDASELPPNAPVATGKAAIRTLWSQLFATPGFALSWQPTKAEVSRGGDLGYTIGTYELSMTDTTGKPVTDRGKYVTVWKKQKDGTWKVVADMFNSNLPAPAAPMR